LVGTGPEEASLRRLAASLGLDRQGEVVGAGSEHELPAYYHAPDLFVLPSGCRSEAFRLGVVGAQAWWVPGRITARPAAAPGARRGGAGGGARVGGGAGGGAANPAGRSAPARADGSPGSQARPAVHGGADGGGHPGDLRRGAGGWLSFGILASLLIRALHGRA